MRKFLFRSRKLGDNLYQGWHLRNIETVLVFARVDQGVTEKEAITLQLVLLLWYRVADRLDGGKLIG